MLEEPIEACGGYQIRAKLGYEVTGTVKVMVTEEKNKPLFGVRIWVRNLELGIWS